jgi:DNA-binding Lrp family transcriptional regulator
MKEVNYKELIIMSLLRENARETLTKMSKRTNIPISTIYEKIKSHENGIIQRHTCIIDFSKLGFHTRAALSIKVPKTKKEELKEYLCKHGNINSIYKINNGYDFWIECIFENIKDLEDFTEHIESNFMVKKDVFYIIDDIKRESFMADPEMLKIMYG